MLKEKQDILIKNIIYFVICFLVGGGFVLIFSYSTSIIYPYFWGNDSAQFLTIGKAWYLGNIPYKDMFDHKGPIIFFIDMIGFYIANASRYGVLFIQIVFMCFTISGILAISQLIIKNYIYGIAIVFITLCSMKYNYVEGNSVEEYCLPFIVWSTYGIVKWFMSDRKRHKFKWSCLYGITTGVCLLTRVTNIAPICGGIIIIFIKIFFEKEYKNIILNIVTFILGFFIVSLPYIVYFYENGLLYDMIYGTILFNIEYSIKCPSWIKSAKLHDVVVFLIEYFSYYIIFIISIFKFIRKEYLEGIACIITGMIETYIFMSGYAYRQYALICIAQIVLLLNEITIFITNNKFKTHFIPLFVCIFVLFHASYTIYMNVFEIQNKYKNYSIHIEREWERLFRMIPKKDLNSFVVYGGNKSKEIYLLSNTIPCYKYHIIQEWHSSFTEEIRKDILKTFKYGNAKWILTEGGTHLINTILKDRYSLIEVTDRYKLYRLVNHVNQY